MTTDDKIRYEKLQYNINRQVAKIQEIRISSCIRISKNTKFTHSPLGKLLKIK